MSDYTPNTDVIRQAVTFERNRLGEPRTIKVEAFERWLTARDSEVAATERERITSAIAEDTEHWQETADRLRVAHEYTDAIRYDNYAAARRVVAAEIRKTEPKAPNE